MSTIALDRPHRLFRDEPGRRLPLARRPVAPGRTPFETPRTTLREALERPVSEAPARMAGPTLEDLVTGSWDALLGGAPAACPVCSAVLAPRFAAASVAVAGRCTGCASELS